MIHISDKIRELPKRSLKKWIKEREKENRSEDWLKELEKLKDDSRAGKKSETD